MSFRLKLAFFISFLFLLSIGNALFTFKLESYGEEKIGWIDHTHEVILESENLLIYLLDAETGQRGYLLTEDSTYLEPYHFGISHIQKSFDKLKFLTADNEIQQKRLDKMKATIQLKLDELKETIELEKHNNNNNTQALEVVKNNSGKMYMDNIRDALDEFIYTEVVLLEERKKSFRDHRSQVTVFIVVEVILFVLLAISTIIFFNRNLFEPLNRLLKSTKQIEDGKKVIIEDLQLDNEMGYLLKNFITMNEKVNKSDEKVEYITQYDDLTGLNKRTTIYDEVYHIIDENHDIQKNFALVFLDINKFKNINDSFGYDIADTILKHISSKLKESIGTNSLTFRTSGNEFLLVLKDVQTQMEVSKIISNFLKIYEASIKVNGKFIDISFNMGVSFFQDDIHSIDNIIKYASIALTNSKQDEKSSYKFFDKSMLEDNS